MSPELVKEIKDAGFPQHLDGPVMDDSMSEVVSPDTHSYEPNLSELISELGDKFGVLDRFKDGTFGAYIPNDIGTNGLGATPEEAVARLWLALNKK